MHSQTRLIGFTLVELLIVVVIVGIIAAFAVPAYRGHVISSRTSEATTFLAEMRVQVEQHFQDYRTYAGFGCSPPGAANHFTYACPTLSATAFTITATGKSSQGMAGFGYSINQANTRTTTALPNGWTGSGSACWVLSKDGSC